MPNWCSNKYIFFPADKREECKAAVKILRMRFEKAYDLEGAEEKPSGRISPWLGRILVMYGLDYEKISCRADFSLPEDEGDNAFVLYSESAWCPTPEAFDAIIAKNYLDKDGNPLIKMVYGADEPGCGIFYSTDTKHQFFSEEIKIDLDMGKTEGFDSYSICEYVESKEAAIKVFREAFKQMYQNKDGFETMKKAADKYSFESWVTIFKYTASIYDDSYFEISYMGFEDPEPLPKREDIMELLSYSEGQYVIYKNIEGKTIKGTIKSIDRDTGKAEVDLGGVVPCLVEIDPGNDGYFLEILNLAEPAEKDA